MHFRELKPRYLLTAVKRVKQSAMLPVPLLNNLRDIVSTQTPVTNGRHK